ncbi:MAG: hypothetical protein KGY65_03950 [Candidatus Thermoplasmatota archaeon]|nr:hypothetical protein [Candidatus Thermoplasmatota archaeon]MBS3801884.1 hypothetical protein [Candidatus Thermoplasmatota archaeon]
MIIDEIVSNIPWVVILSVYAAIITMGTKKIYELMIAKGFKKNVELIIIMFLSIFLSITLLWKRLKMSPFQFVKQPANPFNSFQQQDTPWK